MRKEYRDYCCVLSLQQLNTSSSKLLMVTHMFHMLKKNFEERDGGRGHPLALPHIVVYCVVCVQASVVDYIFVVDSSWRYVLHMLMKNLEEGGEVFSFLRRGGGEQRGTVALPSLVISCALMFQLCVVHNWLILFLCTQNPPPRDSP